TRAHRPASYDSNWAEKLCPSGIFVMAPSAASSVQGGAASFTMSAFYVRGPWRSASKIEAGKFKMAIAKTMADRDGLIWYDGKMVPWRDATTHVLTHTLHYGMGVFEGVRAYKTDN